MLNHNTVKAVRPYYTAWNMLKKYVANCISSSYKHVLCLVGFGFKKLDDKLIKFRLAKWLHISGSNYLPNIHCMHLFSVCAKLFGCGIPILEL